MAKDNVFRVTDQAVEAVENGQPKMEREEDVIDATRYSCVVPADGSVFTPMSQEELAYSQFCRHSCL